MITKIEFADILYDYGFSKEKIEQILKKRINTLLARGKKKEIREIIKVLKENEIKQETIENCLSVLATGKAEEIKEILQVLKENGIKQEKIENCLSVLAMGKAEEIKEILQVLKENGIKQETIENCLSVLARGKTEKIKKILRILKNNGIKKEKIEENWGWILINSNNNIIQETFLNNPENILKYMQLKDIYNRIITMEEIKEICTSKNIKLEELFNKIPNGEKVIESLRYKGEVYIGKSFGLDKKFMKEHADKIIEISKSVSNKFFHNYPYFDKQELESEAMLIIIEKCGDIAFNCNYNYTKMFSSIYNKTYKYLKSNLKEKEICANIDFERLKKHNIQFTENEEIDFKKWKINKYQENLLRNLSILIEQGLGGNDLIDEISEILMIDKEEVILQLEEIKEIMKKGNEEQER